MKPQPLPFHVGISCQSSLGMRVDLKHAFPLLAYSPNSFLTSLIGSVGSGYYSVNNHLHLKTKAILSTQLS